jgi:hypothetical protein
VAATNESVAGLEVLQLLLTAHPAAASERDSAGMRPFELISERHAAADRARDLLKIDQ